MKDKILFGLQVFTTLILFMSIFVSYLKRNEIYPSEQVEKNSILKSGIGSTGNVSDVLNTSFTTSLKGIISSGK